MSYPAAVLLSLWAAAGIVYDWRDRRLPNGLTFGGMGAGLVYLLVYGQGIGGSSWQSSLLAGGAALLLLLPVYAFRMIGAGDVKFAMALGILGGGTVLFFTMVAGSMLLGAMALWSLTRSGRLPLVSLALQRFGVRMSPVCEPPPRHLPFGVAHGLAFIAALWAGFTF